MEEEEIIQSEKGPKCPFCGTVSTYIEDVDWFFNYKTCGHCGRNYVARKTAENPMFESKSTMNRSIGQRKGHIVIGDKGRKIGRLSANSFFIFHS